MKKVLVALGKGILWFFKAIWFLLRPLRLFYSWVGRKIETRCAAQFEGGEGPLTLEKEILFAIAPWKFSFLPELSWDRFSDLCYNGEDYSENVVMFRWLVFELKYTRIEKIRLASGLGPKSSLKGSKKGKKPASKPTSKK